MAQSPDRTTQVMIHMTPSDHRAIAEHDLG